MTEYLLPSHVHFCRRGDALVFVDLRHDDYILVTGHAAAALQGMSLKRTEESSQESGEALKELLEGGLLTTDSNAGRSIAPTRIQLALEHLIDWQNAPEINVTLNHLWAFVIACTSAALQLRRSRLEDVVKAVEQRKARHSPGPTDVAAARELTAIFHKLRSLFPLDYLCLYDSLALLEFLARYDNFPTWVFGVKLEPWAAHCWVQDARYIFNEGVEEAAGYTPVMAI